MIEFSVSTSSREVLLDITGQIQNALAGAEEFDGLVHVYVPHTTAGVTINEGADPSVADDIVDTLAKLVPRDAGYKHREGNADAHVKTTLVGSHSAIPVRGGKLQLGTWQSVYLAEFDGPRSRRVWIELTAAK